MSTFYYQNTKELEKWSNKIRNLYNSDVATIFQNTIGDNFETKEELIESEFGDFNDDITDLIEESAIMNALTDKNINIHSQQFFNHYQSIVRGLDGNPKFPKSAAETQAHANINNFIFNVKDAIKLRKKPVVKEDETEDENENKKENEEEKEVLSTHYGLASLYYIYV